MKQHAIAALSLLLVITPTFAEPMIDSRAGSLFDTIAAQDKRLFDAYNSCDLKTLTGMVSEDLEFYHDQTGLSRGRKAFVGTNCRLPVRVPYARSLISLFGIGEVRVEGRPAVR